MGGNRYPTIPSKLSNEYRKMSKSDLIETLYDLSELQSTKESKRCDWVLSQINSRRMANKNAK